MKTKEQIKEEYDKYELQEEVIKNKASLDAILEIAKNDLFENVRVTTKEKKANKIEKLKSRILNLFSFFTETENQIEIYDEDNEILDEFLEFCSQQNMFLTTNVIFKYLYLILAFLVQFVTIFYFYFHFIPVLFIKIQRQFLTATHIIFRILY